MVALAGRAVTHRRITDYLAITHQVQAEAIEFHSDLLALLDEISEAILVSSEDPANQDALTTLLFLNAHSLFLAAASSALSGQVAPVFALLRNAAESALYALLVSGSQDHSYVWLKRKEDRRTCRKFFTAEAALKKLQEVDGPLADLFGIFIELAIDNGAHPNVDSVLRSLNLKQSSERNEASLIYLHPASSATVASNLVACAELGCALLLLARAVFPKCLSAVAAYTAEGPIKLRLLSVIELRYSVAAL